MTRKDLFFKLRTQYLITTNILGEGGGGGVLGIKKGLN